MEKNFGEIWSEALEILKNEIDKIVNNYKVDIEKIIEYLYN